MPAPLFRLIALSGFLAVLLGALGAHTLKATLDARDTLGSWQTAAYYHLAHSIACLALVSWASARPARAKSLQRIATLWLTGCLLFAGSIYALALGGPRFLGPVTPLGGLAFLAGWALLGLETTREPQP
jgi:uncharacterized membrane protein YgdD (TMEM256/DUF423 family)